MNIIYNTNFTPYSKDAVIKPKHPVWLLKNTGFYDCVINGIARLAPGEYFGIDALPLLIPVVQSQMNGGEKIEIVNDTQFSISFIIDNQIVNFYPQVVLIETSFQFKKN